MHPPLAAANTKVDMSLADFKQFDAYDLVFRNSKGKVRPNPELPEGAPIADTHCHLGMLSDAPLSIARAAHHGVRFIECITDPSEHEEGELVSTSVYESIEPWRVKAVEHLAELGSPVAQAPRIRMACGVHPHNARLWDQAKPQLLALLENPLTSCIGEIGLDYHYDLSPRDVQREVFAEQLRIAHETGLPVELHIREAHDEAVEILKREGVPEAGCVLHCFNLGSDDARPFVELGCYIAFGGPLTFKKEYETRASLALIPSNRLLTETDAPYMAPEPARGVVCEPAHTAYTLRMLLDCMGYVGEERALELMSPRPKDVLEGETPKPPLVPDFLAMQSGAGELEMVQRIFGNAVALLDRPNPIAR